MHLRMHPSPRLVCSDRPEGLLFHVSNLPCHRPVRVRRTIISVQGPALQARIRGTSISVQDPSLRALPVPPCLHEIWGGGSCSPERARCSHPHLDEWLILAQSRDKLCEHRDLMLRHLIQLGVRVNWEKSKLSPTQRISF